MTAVTLARLGDWGPDELEKIRVRQGREEDPNLSLTSKPDSLMYIKCPPTHAYIIHDQYINMPHSIYIEER